MKPDVLAVIPVRFESSRFPGKALCQVGRKPLIQLIYEQVSSCRLVDTLVIATDSTKIRDAVQAFGGRVIMTSPRHRTGSDRASEAMKKLGGNIIISIQADNLGVKSQALDRVITDMRSDQKIEFGTLAKKIDNENLLSDPNRVKILIDSSNHAIWFSRSPLPYLQGHNGNLLNHFDYYYHIGVYFFRKKTLEHFHSWPRSRYEKAESLEQLRILENHRRIKVYKIKSRVFEIDAPDDLKELKGIYY